MDKDKKVTRLFPNYRDLELDYFKRTGIFPIMHTTAIKQEVVDKYPWVAQEQRWRGFVNVSMPIRWTQLISLTGATVHMLPTIDLPCVLA